MNASRRRTPIHALVGKVLVEKCSMSPRRPTDGSLCTVYLSNLYVEDVDLFENSEYFKKDITVRDVEMRIGDADCPLDRGLEEAVRTMGPLEECRLKLVWNKLEVTVFAKLIKFTDSEPIVRWPDQTKYEVASLAREKGNMLFKNKRYEDAFHRFAYGVKVLLMMRDIAFELRMDLYAKLCNNLAACQLHFRNYDYTISLCDKVLTQLPNNLKCIIRRMDAYIGAKNYEMAKLDAKKSLELDPKNTYVVSKLELIERNLAAQESRYADMVKKMFALH